MKNINFDYKDILNIHKVNFTNYFDKLSSISNHLKESIDKKYDTPYAFLNSVDDDLNIIKIEVLKRRLNDLNIKTVFLIGIGGSNLGTLAVFQAIKGLYYNDLNKDLNFYFVDTIDYYYTFDLLSIFENKLKQNIKVALVLVSKSGDTIEFLINASLFINKYKKYDKEYYKYIVAITDEDSNFYKIALDNRYNILTIAKNIPGRYSVLSPAALLPLSLLSIDILKLLQGAKFARDYILNNKDNMSIIKAIILYTYYTLNYNINDLFLFSPNYFMLGNWYRQLFAESLGKDLKGMTPTVSIGTTDLHSIGQLYFQGPYDKVTTFIYFNNLNKSINNLKVEENSILINNKFLVDKSLNDIKYSIIKGVKDSYIKEKRPFLSIEFLNNSEYEIGQFIMFSMVEIIYFASLLDVNPFSQPGVQFYKDRSKYFIENIK